MDDGGGFYSAWEAVHVIKKLIETGKLSRPRYCDSMTTVTKRRTIRIVGWNDEEMGARGALTYYQDHINEIANHVIAVS